MTLLILAAGMGSRFGGLKQLQPVGPNGEFIIDYSIYDAIKAGFDKVVFIIKEENYEDFKNTIGKRIENHIKVEYVFQKIEDIPINKKFNRIKPWGTGQAILAAKNIINDNFLIINADDFYGRDAFLKAYEFMKSMDDKHFGLVAYEAKNTLSENGSVKRGICEIEKNLLTGITESSVQRVGNLIHCESLTEKREFDIELDREVNMNMLIFTPKIFDYLENDFITFLESVKNPLEDEYLIPEVVSNHIKNNDFEVQIIKTTSVWHGMTYKDDLESVKKSILDLIDKGEYNKKLWE